MTKEGLVPGSRAAKLAARLELALGSEMICTGTSAAAAMIDLAHADTKASGLKDGFARWLALPLPAIHSLKSDLDRLIAGGFHVQVRLPAGTLATGQAHGQLRVGSEVFGIDADRPGLHPHDELPDDPRGGNLDKLLVHLDQMTLGLPARGIGLPSAVIVHDRMPKHVLQWAPFTPAAGTVLQHDIHGTGSVRFCSLSLDMVRKQAEHIVLEMETLWSKQIAIGIRALAARDAGHAFAREHDCVSFRAVTIDLSNQLFDETYDVLLDFDAWDDALRPAILQSRIDHDELPEDHLGPDLPASKTIIENLRSRGADGWIDGIAIAIGDAAPGGLRATLARLASAHETRFTIDNPKLPMRGSLSWRNGRICGRLRCNRFDLYDSHIIFYRQALPQTIQVAAIGRKLTDVAELPFAFDGTIAGVEVDAEGTTFKILNDAWLVDCVNGRVWR